VGVRRRRKPGSRPVGGGGSRHPASLANLRRGGPVIPDNDHARKHGGYAAIARDRLEAREREVFDALSADTPLRGPDGGLPVGDAVMVRLLADVLCRLDDVSADIRDHGWRDRETGEHRPVVELESRLRREAREYAAELGLTARSRVALGVDVQRGLDLARAWAEEDDREAGRG
jgi:hypothetical protein